jgi:hypothetical protein
MTEIVKVQVPLATNVPAAAELALVYEEGRKRMVQQPLDLATRLAMGDDLKAFFHAQFSAGHWTIGRRVRDREW